MPGDVAVAIIKRPRGEEDEFLLVSSKKDFGVYTGYYYPPGGHVEKGEEDSVALARELREELELNIRPVKKLATTKNDKDETTSWWLATIISGTLKVNKEEIKDAGYFTADEIKRMKVWPATMKIFQEFIFDKGTDSARRKRRST